MVDPVKLHNAGYAQMSKTERLRHKKNEQKKFVLLSFCLKPYASSLLHCECLVSNPKAFLFITNPRKNENFLMYFMSERKLRNFTKRNLSTLLKKVAVSKKTVVSLM